MSEWYLVEPEDYHDDREQTGLSGGSIDNERCVELALAKRWVANSTQSNKVYEIGAVMPYYWECNHHIIDPYDELATIPDFVENIDLTGQEVFSISTIEHIGLDEYGEQHQLDENGAVQALQQILNQASRCFITFPVGYNSVLDEWVENNLDRLNCFGYHKTRRYDAKNHWPPVYSPLWEHQAQVKHLDYDYHFWEEGQALHPHGQRWATFIICIEGWLPETHK